MWLRRVHDRPDDFELAMQAARVMDTQLEAHAHLSWLRAVTQHLVQAEEARIVAVADELCRHQVMTGDQVKATMRGTVR